MLLPWECNCVIQAGARPKSAPYRPVAEAGSRSRSLSPVAHRTAVRADTLERDEEVPPAAATDDEITQVASSDLEHTPAEMSTEVPAVAPIVPPALEEVQDPPATPQAQELPAQQLSPQPASRSTGSHEGDSGHQGFQDLVKACSRSSEDVQIYSDQNPPSSTSSDEEGPPGTAKRLIKQAKKEAGLFLFSLDHYNVGSALCSSGNAKPKNVDNPSLCQSRNQP